MRIDPEMLDAYADYTEAMVEVTVGSLSYEALRLAQSSVAVQIVEEILFQMEQGGLKGALKATTK